MPPDFHKTLEAFNLHRAKDLAAEQGLILVEGFYDCMKIWQAGFQSVAALMGSSMSEEQAALIVSAVGQQGKVILLFAAGRKCREDILARLSSQVYVKVIALGKEGTQPDGLTEKEIVRLLK